MFAANKSRRLPEKLFRVVLWVITLFFSAFLTGLGELVIKDLPKVSEMPSYESFKPEKLKKLEQMADEREMTLREMKSQLSKDRIVLGGLAPAPH